MVVIQQSCVCEGRPLLFITKEVFIDASVEVKRHIRLSSAGRVIFFCITSWSWRVQKGRNADSLLYRWRNLGHDRFCSCSVYISADKKAQKELFIILNEVILMQWRPWINQESAVYLKVYVPRASSFNDCKSCQKRCWCIILIVWRSSSVVFLTSCSWRLACRCPAPWSWWGKYWSRTRRNTTKPTEAPRRSSPSRSPTPTATRPACASRPLRAPVRSPPWVLLMSQSGVQIGARTVWNVLCSKNSRKEDF